jgi:hypothetical protein
MSMNFGIFTTCLVLAGIPLAEDRVIDGRDVLLSHRGGDLS